MSAVWALRFKQKHAPVEWLLRVGKPEVRVLWGWDEAATEADLADFQRRPLNMKVKCTGLCATPATYRQGDQGHVQPPAVPVPSAVKCRGAS